MQFSVCMMNNTAHGTDNYNGPDRRRHKIFVTRNSEYHCRDGVCIAVRNKKDGEFVVDHPAIGRRISAGVRFNPEGAVAAISTPESPEIGDQLCFSATEPVHSATDVITSPLRAVSRPQKDIVHSYPN